MINRFNTTGIHIHTAGGVSVRGCYIGLGLDGSTIQSNTQIGIVVNNTAGNTIGGSTAADRNVISGNGLIGVEIIGANADSNTVQGNYVGLDATGLLARGNFTLGVAVFDGDGNIVGGGGAGEGNVVSGNGLHGIQVAQSTALPDGNLIRGNIVGLDKDGDLTVPNIELGVTIYDGDANEIGGTGAGEGNVISGNTLAGVQLSPVTSLTNSLMRGNIVGLNSAGTAARPNGMAGVDIGYGDTGTVIGGTSAAARNVISGNTRQGIIVSDNDGLIISGNYIGLNAAGTAAVGNVRSGVLLIDDFTGVSNCVVGGTAAGAGNVISGNGFGVSNLSGVEISGPLNSGNRIEGNIIGLDAAGAVDLGNAGAGVNLPNAPVNVTVGGTTAAARNVISGNGGSGVALSTGIAGASVLNNYIGLNAAGTAALGNVGTGVLLSAGTGNAIGGSGQGNVISGNGLNGIRLQTTSNGNTIQGNVIGLDAAGAAAVPNLEDGVLITSGTTNTIGGSTAGQGNLIAGNGGQGIELRGAAVTGNVIRGNTIGLSLAGAALGNGLLGEGVLIGTGATGNTVGGTAAGEGNIISGNLHHGVQIAGSTSTGNGVYGNLIGLGLTGTESRGNGGAGVQVTGPDNFVGSAAGLGRNHIAANAMAGVMLTTPSARAISS